MKRTAARIALALCLLASACSLKKGPEQTGCVLKVGIVYAQETDAGENQRAGYDLALNEINQQGLLQGCTLELIYANEGTSSTPEAVQSSILNLVDDGAVIVIGGTEPDAGIRAVPIAKYLKIPLLVPSTVNDEVTGQDNEWAFRLSAANRTTADAAFDMLRARFGPGAGIAILYEQSVYGESTAIVSAQSAMDLGLTIVSYQGFAPGALEFLGLMEEARSSQPAAVFLIASSEEQARGLLEAASKLNVNILMIGSGSGFHNRSLLENSKAVNFSSDQSLILATDLLINDISDQWQADLEYQDDALDIHKMEAFGALKVVAAALNTVIGNAGNTILEQTTAENLPKLREKVAAALRNEMCVDLQNGAGCYSIMFDLTGQSSIEPVFVQVESSGFQRYSSP